MPTVSVIMPCYNAARFLSSSVGSVLAQTFTDWELVAVDDGSTDETAAVLESFGDGRIRIIRQANAGVTRARNAGIRAARGHFLAFLDADDTWHPEFLQRMLTAVEQRGEPAIAYCGWQNLGLEGGRGMPFVPPDYENERKTLTLLEGCRWPIHAALLPTGLVRQAGGFDETQRVAEDFDLWLRTATTVPLVRVPDVLAYYHHHGIAQLTLDQARLALYQVRAQQKYLATHPETARVLGWAGRRRLIWEPLLRKGYAAYWSGDLPTARLLFREVMRHAYGRPKDWLYMLPAWLPESWHAALLRWRRTSGERPQ
jgi:glycosyltransferase involved in cell wall biosynthesis